MTAEIHASGQASTYSARRQEHRDVDLADDLSAPLFKPLPQDPQLFRQMRVDQELGTVVWLNGADLHPDVLHGDPPA